MEYRNWAGEALQTSLLGFGCMRFPVDAQGNIDEALAEKMLNEAKAAGVNYFDTAYPYHGGASEPFLGRVLKSWPRDSFCLATKLPAWKIKTLQDAVDTFQEQLARLGVDYVDFYLLHSMSGASYDRIKALGVVDWCWAQKKAGRIRHFGFSFHDSYPMFEHILNDQPWDFCQIQYNYMDTETQAGDKGYALAESKGIPMVIMEPVKGGTLAALPADAAAPLKALRPEASLASWALRWVAGHKNVHVVLSGMSSEEQVSDNLATFQSFEPLTAAEQAAVQSCAETLRSRIRIGCTGCRYCMPCPQGVGIPQNFNIWNNASMYQNEESAKRIWARFDEDEKAKNCIGCGKCEAACPQHLPIRAKLAELQTELDALAGLSQ